MLWSLRLRFLLLWLLIVLLGFGIVFLTTRRMLSHVREITEAASQIGHSDLDARVPTTKRNDEVSHLALTLNRMLDRIESSMHQLHTITDSLAHDLRSPLTAIRGKLEMSLSISHGRRTGRTDCLRHRRTGSAHRLSQQVARCCRGQGGCASAHAQSQST